MASPATGRSYGRRSPDERRGDRRARLLACALDRFGTQGYRATTIEELCAGAGVSTRNLYEEFGSRETLLIAVHDRINAGAVEAVLSQMGAADAENIPARVRAGTRAYLNHMTSDRRFARVALVESVGVSPAVEAARRAAIDRFVALIEVEAARLVDAGLAPRRDFRLTAVALAGALNGLVSTWTAKGDWDDRVPAVAEEAARIIVLALTGPELD